MALIEFKNWNNTDKVYIEKSHVIACIPDGPEHTTIYMAVGDVSEEWKVSESIQAVCFKINIG